MADNDIVKKDICEEKHKSIKTEIVGLKANITTSKESLSNRLDEVDIALLGDRTDPGGLLRDIIEIEKELKAHQEKVTKELRKQNNKIYVGLIILALIFGGKFLGVSIDTIKNFFETKTTIKNVQPEKIEFVYDIPTWEENK
jgi:hypothetical protein